jgi:hypothetical protein
LTTSEAELSVLVFPLSHLQYTRCHMLTHMGQNENLQAYLQILSDASWLTG